MRISLTIALMIVLAGLWLGRVSAQDKITVVYGGGRTSVEFSAWLVDPQSDELYLRANDVAKIFKATQFWNASSRKVVLGIERKRFTLTVDTRVVVIDGEPIMMHNPIRYEAGFVMIPMEFVVEIAAPFTPSVLEWDRPSLTLRVDKVGYNVGELSFASTGDRSTATVSLNEPLIHHVESDTPGLVRLKIYGGRIDADKFNIREARGLFNGVRAEQTERDAYIYFDVTKQATRVRVEREDSPPRLVVILEKGDLPEIPEPEFAGRKRVEIVDSAGGVRRSLSVDVVVLDPGHGGKDNGKMGGNGVLEKDVNLRIAEKTRELLREELNVEVIMTREDDRLLSLTRRTEIANEGKGDLFISIHCNSWFSTQAGGFEAYFLSPARTEWDRAVAMAENAADDFMDGGGDVVSDIDFILWDMVQAEYLSESSHFAELTQKAMNDRLDIRNRGVKQANFTVLQGARMPAVLIETAFLSNPREESMLTDMAFQRKVAEGIVDAVRQFRERYQ
ncbi:MAG: N-acetylmuramoyl-L-alanine amidase [Candidatus Krumholzibacteria bacterium]|nr:N-acetylmuramoyl-L-alanine amidase [Candidatus Krumholzibacteria bacterium]